MICFLKNIVLFSAFWQLVFPSFGQDYKAELIRVSQTYKNSKKLSFDVTANIFKTYTSKSPSITEKTYYKKSGNLILITGEEKTSLFYDTCNIIVSHKNRIIDIVHHEKADQNEQEKIEQEMFLLMDSTLQQLDSVVFRGVVNNVSHYIVYANKSFFKITDVYFDTKNGFFKKIIFYYNKKDFPQNNKVEIIYNDLNTNPGFSNKLFSPGNFIIKKHGKLLPVEKYNDYQLFYHQNTSI